MSIIIATSRLLSLPRGIKKLIVCMIDVALCFITTWLAFCLRFDSFVYLSRDILFVGVFSTFVALPIFTSFGLYRAIYRYSGWFATLSLVKASLIYSAVFSVPFLMLEHYNIPRSIGLLQPILLFVAVGTTRLLAKYFLSGVVNGRRKSIQKQRVALIYGAGSAGRQIASGLRHADEVTPFGFIDDDERLWNGLINGLPVFSPGEIPSLVDSNKAITDILLAIPSASRTRQKEILKALSNLPVHVRILPALSDLANGVVKVEHMRDVEIEDVLGRDPVQANEKLLHQNIKGKVVLVTGAGGSIGSELCRQIIAQSPIILVLFELSEFALYTVERELSQLSTSVIIKPILGSVLDCKKLFRVMVQFNVQTVYHAAAYKHVPLIEINPASGVLNNVFGTLRAVESACKAGVETFVLISTDKAVRPTNVMGCSKRMAEIVLQAKSLQAKSLQVNGLTAHATKLTMVRFGNVLGSSGSVVPAFREQIRNGGPVTVTHRDIVRYFMTIPEAAQLVIQAGAISEGGDVMVLDMGEPVKIVDLARRMIHLTGFSHKDELTHDGDIEIVFTGLRPGEKLYEELLIGDNTLPTENSQILRAVEDAMSWDVLEPILLELECVIKSDSSDAIRALLKKAVPEFNPSSENRVF